jgi:hypothetical protein
MLKADIYVAYKKQGEHVDESDRLFKGVRVSPQSFDQNSLENFSRLSCNESIQSKRKGGFKTACT